MDIETTIKEIIGSIKRREFLNEAEITNGIVLRILNSLNWNVFDTAKVKPQYGVEGKKIDFALCYPDNKPVVIIEVKALGKAVNTDEQVLMYAFKTGIPVAILTDGQEWHFYLPAARGSLTERRFYKLDLLVRDPNEIVDVLSSYLGYEAIKNGSAITKANSDYDKQYKNQEINLSIPKAWNKLLQENDSILVNLIAEKVADICGFEPSEETIINFLIGLSSASDTPVDYKYQKAPKPIEPSNNGAISVNDGFKGVVFNNSVFETSRNSIGTLESILKLTITQFPNSLNSIQIKTTGRSRSLISKQKSGLYQNRPDLEADCARQLPNGWWLGTNYSKREIIKFCEIVEVSITREYGNQNIGWSI